MSNNLRIARSPTEQNKSVRYLKRNKKKVKEDTGVRAKRRVTFVSDDDEPTSMLEDFYYLIGIIYRDDEDFRTYQTTKIYVHKTTGYIVGERAYVHRDGSISKCNENDPIHIKIL